MNEVQELTLTLETQGFMPKILEVEREINRINKGKHDDLPVSHYQVDGIYARSLFIPKGSVLTGQIHLKENIFILAQGEICQTNGAMAHRIKAPFIMVDLPGTKRLGYAVEDCTVITIHRTDLKAINEIVESLASDSFIEHAQKLLGDK